MDKLRFRHWALIILSVWLSGILYLFLRAVAETMSENVAMGLGQIWTEAVGFAFAGGALYFAWRRAQGAVLSMSFSLDEDVTERTVEISRGPLIDMPIVDLYVRNLAPVGAHDIKIEVYPWTEQFRSQIAVGGTIHGSWQEIGDDLGPWGLRWAPGRTFVGARSHLNVGAIHLSEKIEPGRKRITYWVWGSDTQVSAGSLFLEIVVL